jgi:rhodanese-related sulfurtransferase
MPARVDAPAAHQLIERGVQLVDVLPASIFDQEHLPTAQSIPLETMTVDAVAGLDRSRPVLVYCFDQH